MKYKEKTTYFFCPDKECQGFYDKEFKCEFYCPKEEKLIKAIKCWNCKKLIKLPGNHNSFCRVDCDCGASVFDRMSGKSYLIRS